MGKSCRKIVKQTIWLVCVVLSLLIVTACAGEPSPIGDALPTTTETPATIARPSLTSTATLDPTPEPIKQIVIGLADAILDRQIFPDCIDQFPIHPTEDGRGVLCLTFDDWIKGPLDLGGGYEMVVGAEAWYVQDGVEVPMLVPLITAHRKNNQMQIHGALIQEFRSFVYDGEEGAWLGVTGFNLDAASSNRRMFITLGLAVDGMHGHSGSSTQGFGFDAPHFSQEALDEFFETGDATILGNLVWPAIHIGGGRVVNGGTIPWPEFFNQP